MNEKRLKIVELIELIYDTYINKISVEPNQKHIDKLLKNNPDIMPIYETVFMYFNKV